MKKVASVVFSIIVIAIVAFLGLKFLLFSFYKAPEKKIVASTKIENSYRIMEINPDNTLELTYADRDGDFVNTLIVKYKLHGQGIVNIIGPLYLIENQLPWNSFLWVPGKDKKPYIVTGEIYDIYPESSWKYKSDFELGKIVLIIGDNEVMLGNMKHEINMKMPDWVNIAINK